MLAPAIPTRSSSQRHRTPVPSWACTSWSKASHRVKAPGALLLSFASHTPSLGRPTFLEWNSAHQKTRAGSRMRVACASVARYLNQLPPPLDFQFLSPLFSARGPTGLRPTHRPAAHELLVAGGNKCSWPGGWWTYVSWPCAQFLIDHLTEVKSFMSLLCERQRPFFGSGSCTFCLHGS